MKRALIFDLDNTIYPVSSIANDLFDKLFRLVDKHCNEDKETLEAAKKDLTRRNFHLVARQFDFNDDLKQKGIGLLTTLEYNKPMEPFTDYHALRKIPVSKFLVTLGFTRLQWSKIRMLNIEGDFEEIHIVDPETSARTKKDVFNDIMERHRYNPEDVLVIGDDPESEIRAAVECGIETFLFDPDDRYPYATVTYKSNSLRDVLKYL